MSKQGILMVVNQWKETGDDEQLLRDLWHILAIPDVELEDCIWDQDCEDAILCIQKKIWDRIMIPNI